MSASLGAFSISPFHCLAPRPSPEPPTCFNSDCTVTRFSASWISVTFSANFRPSLAHSPLDFPQANIAFKFFDTNDDGHIEWVEFGSWLYWTMFQFPEETKTAELLLDQLFSTIVMPDIRRILSRGDNWRGL